MNGLIDIGTLQLIERGILVLLLALGAGCLGVFAVRWRAVGQARTGAVKARARLESELTDGSDASAASVSPAPGEAGWGDRVLLAALLVPRRHGRESSVPGPDGHRTRRPLPLIARCR